MKVAGLSLREITSRHGVSHVTIKKYLDGKGVKRDKVNVNKKKKGRKVNTPVNQSVNPSMLPAATKMGAQTIRTKEL